MKSKKLIGNILTVLGSVGFIIGLIAAFLPTVKNKQMQLIISSFQAPSSNGFIQAVNNCMNFAMEHSMVMLLIGLAIIGGGILLIISSRTDEQAMNQARQQTHKPVQSVAATRPVTAQAAPVRVAPPRPVESNPFARYMKGDELPKSTATPVRTASADPEQAEASAEVQSHPDDILNIWEKIQQQPNNADELFIEPVQVEDDEPYRRPEKVDDVPPGGENESLPEVNAPEAFENKEKSFINLSLDTDLITDEPASEPTPEADHDAALFSAAQSPSPVEQPPVEKPRPVIRSTFRKSTVDQPAEELEAVPETELPDAPASETAIENNPENTAAMSALQPASRIKSTMGRKR